MKQPNDFEQKEPYPSNLPGGSSGGWFVGYGLGLVAAAIREATHAYLAVNGRDPDGRSLRGPVLR